MEHYTIRQQLLNIIQNGESLITTVRKVLPIIGRNNGPNSSTVERIIEDFEGTTTQHKLVAVVQN